MPLKCDNEAFRLIGEDCGVNVRTSLPKGYTDQKVRIMTLYKSVCKDESMWIKIDFCPVQTQRDGSSERKWSTAGKVTIIAPQMWGRLSVDKKERFIKESFDKFKINIVHSEFKKNIVQII